MSSPESAFLDPECTEDQQSLISKPAVEWTHRPGGLLRSGGIRSFLHDVGVMAHACNLSFLESEAGASLA